MADFIFHFGSEINGQELDRLRDRLQTIKPKEGIRIAMDTRDSQQADSVIAMLERYGFDYQPHGGHEDEYYIIARKRD